MRRNEGRETITELINWDKGQAASERLAGKILEAEGELTKVTTNRFTLYTLVNYDFYQEVNSLSDKETDMTNVNNITIKELSDYI